MKTRRRAMILGVVAALALGLAMAAWAEVSKPATCLDKGLCAEKLRFGQEAFDRGQFSRAKDYFREAVQADPSSRRAWSFYDLSMMYAVAEQVKTTGAVRDSPAPAPDTYQPGQAPATPPTPPASVAPPASPTAPPATPPAIPTIKQDEGC